MVGQTILFAYAKEKGPDFNYVKCSLQYSKTDFHDYYTLKNDFHDYYALLNISYFFHFSSTLYLLNKLGLTWHTYRTKLSVNTISNLAWMNMLNDGLVP